jgi:hypothetical protein
MGNIAEAEHSRSIPLDNPESLYKANIDMNTLNQEIFRVVLLDTWYRLNDMPKERFDFSFWPLVDSRFLPKKSCLPLLESNYKL